MEQTTCAACGTAAPGEELTEFDGQELCPECLERETVVCSCCGARIWQDEQAGDDETILCQRCLDRYYVACDRCGRVMHENDAYYIGDDYEIPYCAACHTRHVSKRSIQDYYYKPRPIFYGDGPRYFGIELEVDEGGEYDVNAEKILDIANFDAKERLYCKHDGSLEAGYEAVSHAMDLDYHLNTMPWKEILAKLREMGYLSHQAGTCGLHIHVNRNAFGETEAAQEAVIARILYFVEQHWNELMRFSRRTRSSMDRWAARLDCESRQPKVILEHAKKGGSNRYVCVNLQNRDTVEFRIYRGTLKYSTFIATLLLTNKICDLAMCLSDEEIKELSWSSFVSGITEPELIQYLKERRLYINEPVVTGEEV